MSPVNPPKGCFTPGCPNLTHGTYCGEHNKEHIRVYDKHRGSASKRGYDHRWAKERKAYLVRNPLCIECMKHDIIHTASVVDHIVPHKGDMVKFWDTKNWQGLCAPCHSVKTAKEDGAFGNPIKGIGG